MIQDPAYSELEKEYLRSLGFEVVDDPDVFARIDANSLVFHISTYLSIAWWIFDGVWPAAMVTSDWGNAGSILSMNYPSHYPTDVHAMFEEYDHVPFIDDGNEESEWRGNYLYWRKHDPSSK